MNRIAGVLCLLAVGAMALPAQEQSDWLGCGKQGLSMCLQMRALKFVDGLNHQGDVEITEGVSLVSQGAKSGRALNAAELEASLPADAEERENQVQQLLVERVARFFSTHTLQVKLPQESINDMKRSLEEGRKKKKKFLLPLLLAIKLKAIALVPIIIGALFILAFKALVVGKIALVLSALIGLQKLLGGHKTVEVVSHGYDTEHHYGRSADDLAYSAHATQ
ncbi:uncharacterized protein LOC132205610 [Neocloeon triangulifer]|uniref:uncharacterized protein LOC132205610 n=1 Tax=Neocloeon triangulifer TaxID=2078957 RepID=UPI00286F4277|nr:uncharacterized protein LOC132205610 [Neocloeon triangulifer]